MIIHTQPRLLPVSQVKWMHIFSIQVAKLDTCPDRENHVIILMDVMHLREDLVYDRHSGLCVCECVCVCTYICIHTCISIFVNIGDVNTHLQPIEKSLSGEQRNRETLASTMLVFMVRGLFSRLEYPYAQFPCHTLSSDVRPLLGGCVSTGAIGVDGDGPLLRRPSCKPTIFFNSFRQGKGLQSSQPLCGGESQSVFLF